MKAELNSSVLRTIFYLFGFFFTPYINQFFCDYVALYSKISTWLHVIFFPFFSALYRYANFQMSFGDFFIIIL